MFAEMGHWYPWATREYIMKKMSYQQFLLYYRMIPESGRLKINEPDRPDLRGMSKLKLGKIIRR